MTGKQYLSVSLIMQVKHEDELTGCTSFTMETTLIHLLNQKHIHKHLLCTIQTNHSSIMHQVKVNVLLFFEESPWKNLKLNTFKFFYCHKLKHKLQTMLYNYSIPQT